MRVLNIFLMGLTMAAVSVPAVNAQTEQRTERIQVPRAGRASMIGVRLSDVSADQVKTYKLSKAEGAVVEAVNPNSPASTGGLHEKDVIVEFDGEHVRSASHLTRLVAETPVGRDVAVMVMRDGRRTNLHLKTEAGGDIGWFDPTFGGRIDRDQMRDAAEQAGRAAREMTRNLPDMMEGMRNGMSNRGRLGVSIQDVTPELAEYFGVKSGVLVASVSADSPAAKAGLKAGDVITAIDGKTVSTPAELVKALPTGDGPHDVDLTVVRDKHERSVKATLEPAANRDRGTARRGQPA
jgi:S1-C subfamily serine protease